MEIWQNRATDTIDIIYIQKYQQILEYYRINKRYQRSKTLSCSKMYMLLHYIVIKRLNYVLNILFRIGFIEACA